MAHFSTAIIDEILHLRSGVLVFANQGDQSTALSPFFLALAETVIVYTIFNFALADHFF
jgi:hypothetical protein